MDLRIGDGLEGRLSIDRIGRKSALIFSQGVYEVDLLMF